MTMRGICATRKLFAPAAIWLIVSLFLATPVLAEVPLENPETAKPAFSGLALFSYYSSSLDFVIEKSPSQVEAKLEKVPSANIPPSLDSATEQFTSSTTNVAHQVVYIDEGMLKLRTLIDQSRFDEARQSVADLTNVVHQANSELAQMEHAIEDYGKVFQVNSATAGSDLKNAYDEVLDKINRIRQMIALYLDITNSLSTTIPGGSGEDLPDPTDLTLQIDPTIAFVGDNISFQGALTTRNGEALAGRKVHILLNGSQYASATTGAGGIYQGSLQIPYWYMTQVSIQALYYPAGSDINVYIASLSPEVMLQVMFYEATIDLTMDEYAYPGLETGIAGKFDYAQWPVPDERRVEIYLDNELLASFQAQAEFNLHIAIDPKTATGQHVITASAQATGRYASVVATAGLTVIRMTPVIDLKTPRMILIPWSAHFSGTANSDQGPLDGALVKMSLRGDQTEVVSCNDGTFDVRMKMGWGLDLLGSDQVRVEVLPKESWNEPVVVTRSVFVVNVVNCAGLLVVLVFLAVYVPGRLKRRLGRHSKASHVPQPVDPVPVYSTESALTGTSEEARGEPVGKPRERILRWYLLALKVVQRIARVSARPDQTLREFARETASAIGPLADRFAEFTRIVERMLYSKHEPSEEDAERIKSLSKNIEKGVGGETK